MKKAPMVHLSHVAEVGTQSRLLLQTLKNYRALINTPQATATECERYAEKVTGTPKPAPTPKPDTAKPEVSKPKARRRVPTGSQVSKGRQEVLQGLRPKLITAMVTAMAKDTITSPELFERLVERGWQPATSYPTGYISATLAENPKIFTRVSRGLYRVATPSTDKGKLGGPANGSDLTSLLLNRNNFSSSAHFLKFLPPGVRKNLSPKDSRRRIVKTVLNRLEALPDRRMQEFREKVRNSIRPKGKS